MASFKRVLLFRRIVGHNRALFRKVSVCTKFDDMYARCRLKCTKKPCNQENIFDVYKCIFKPILKFFFLFSERDPIQIEKSNLVNILKLVIKEVLDSSLRFGHQLDSDHIPLQHFFIVLEHILKHGMKGKKGLLGPKKELWDLLQLVEKKELEAVDITASVRELPTVK